MKFAERIIDLKPSATLAISAKAQKLKSEGKNIIDFSIGEPDFPTPKYIREAAKKAIDDGITRYTAVPGLSALRGAVADYYKKTYDVHAAAGNVIISNGGKQCLYNLCQTLLDPGDQALIPAPYWVSYPSMVELAGGKAAIIQTLPEKNYKVTPAELTQNLTPKTKFLMLNSPSNPTGTCYAKEELDAIAQWALDKGIIVLSDEIYDRLVYGEVKPVSLASWWEKYPDNFVIINGLAKSFAMTGWRVGYAIASENCIKAMSRLQGQSTSSICSISQMAGIAALNGDLSSIEEMRQSFERRRDLAYSIISKWPDIVCPKPDGAFYMFIDVHTLYTEKYPDSTSLCAYLLDNAGVAAVPGIEFGNDNCIRISYAVSDKDLVKGLEAIATTLFKKK